MAEDKAVPVSSGKGSRQTRQFLGFRSIGQAGDDQAGGATERGKVERSEIKATKRSESSEVRQSGQLFSLSTR